MAGTFYQRDGRITSSATDTPAMTDPTPTRAEVVLRRLREPAFGTETTERNLMAEAADLIAALRERAEAAEAERKAADFRLVDRYRNPKTGIFNFPDDVAAIVRALDAARRAEAAAWNDAIDAAKAWHRCEIARLQNQVSENNAYLTRVGASSQDTEANRYCLGLISAHQKSIAAIRALRRAAPTEGEA